MCLSGLEKTDYVALCEPIYLSFSGGCVHIIVLAPIIDLDLILHFIAFIADIAHNLRYAPRWLLSALSDV